MHGPRTTDETSTSSLPSRDAHTPAPFVLSRPHGTVVGHGVRRTFTDAADAADAVRTGASAVVGALPFDRTGPCALIEPTRLERSTARWTRPPSAPPVPTAHIHDTSSDMHLARIDSALRQLRDPAADLNKVVLSREITLSMDTPADPAAVLSNFVDGNPNRNGFCVDLTPAGLRYTGCVLVGSSPEVLIRREGRRVTAHPLAGSAPRRSDPTADADSGAQLAASPKERDEHRFVVDWLRTTLTPLCSELIVPDEPSLTTTPQLWHLGTPISGELRDSSVTALDLARALHPTPAVCGTPTVGAYRVITELEGDRGFYGGAVGWCDARGDGEWMVAIRCVELSGDRRTARARAGGGIVAASVPHDELAETTTKFGTVLRAFGTQSAP